MNDEKTLVYIDKQISLLADISGFILGIEFSVQIGRQTIGYAVFDSYGSVVKPNFASYEEAKRYCQEMEYDLE